MPTDYFIDGTPADCQLKINSGIAGDRINFPLTGTFTWNSAGCTLSTPRTINLNGSTIIRTGTSLPFYYTCPSLAATNGFGFQVSGGNFTEGTFGGVSNVCIKVDSSTFATTLSGNYPKFRFSYLNCVVTDPSLGGTFMDLYGCWGLIDHCTFAAGGAAEMLHLNGWGADGGLPGNGHGNSAGWSVDVTPGGPDGVYIEDCIFTNNNTGVASWNGCSAIQAYYGAITVLRNCILSFCQIDQHGTAGQVGVRWYEFYRNLFVSPTNITHNTDSWFAIRAGAGVIWSNTTTGTNGHAGLGTFQEEDNAGNATSIANGDVVYPFWYQVGRGKSSRTSQPYNSGQAFTPTYYWDNSGTLTNPASSTANVVIGTDVVTGTPLPGYSPYQYPYLFGTGGPGPALPYFHRLAAYPRLGCYI